MYKYISQIFLLFCILFLQLSAHSQKVGVVLSGGGAKGYAHVGFLEALEQNNIPIDYISGTSIGAIVGSLYAIGYNPNEIRAILASPEFYKWSLGEVDLEEEYYFKQTETGQSWIELPIKREKKGIMPQLPTNLVPPDQMDLRFLQFYSQACAAANYNFDSLMVPFFCVATDIHESRPHVMHKGNLPASVRASMTFPGYFKPIYIDSVLLFDGGMVNNFPADVMQSYFEPDVIIGCKVAKNPPKPDPDDLYKQLMNVFVKATNYKTPPNGIVVEPDVEKFPMLDFSSYYSIEIQGYKATMSKMDSIKLLVSRKANATALAQKRAEFKQKFKPLLFQNITVNGVDAQTVDYILKNIWRNRQLLTFNQFETEYFKLLSDKLIESAYPYCVFNSTTGYFDLYLDISTKKAFTLYVGGNVASNLRNMGYVGIEHIFQKKNVYSTSANIVVGTFYNSFQGGFRMDFPTRNNENNRVLEPYFVDFSFTHHNWNYFTLSSDWFVDNEQPAQFKQQETHAQANWGRPVGNRGKIMAGFSYGQTDDRYYHTKTIERSDVPDVTLFDFSSVNLKFDYSTLNYKEYPNSGKFFSIGTRYVTGLETYTPGTTAEIYGAKPLTDGHSWLTVSSTFIKYPTLAKWFTLGYRFDAIVSSKSTFSNSFSTLLSAYGFTPFPQSKVVLLERFRANAYGSAGIIPIFKVAPLVDIRTEAYVFQPYQSLITDKFEPNLSEPFPTPQFMASGAVVFHSPFGPLAATVSYFHNEQENLYFQVNFGYILFNKRGLD